MQSSYHLCPIGDETLAAMHSCGYGALAVGLVAAYENGVRHGQLFSSGQLKQCGLDKNLAKKVVNQCEGRGIDQKKVNKLERSKKGSGYMRHDKEELEYIIECLVDDDNYPALILIFQGMMVDEVPEKYIDLYRQFCREVVKKATPPENFIVKEFFSQVRYGSKELTSLDLSRLRLRGRPARYFIYPESFDELAKLFGVRMPDTKQHHSEIYGERKIESLFDALYLQWHYRNIKEFGKEKENRHSVTELCNVLGDSPDAMRARNKRVNIKAKPNFKEIRVNGFVINGLLIKHRGDTKFVLDLPETPLSEGITYEQRLRYLPRFSLTKAGLSAAKKEWKAANCPADFYECLRVTYRTISTYEFIEQTSVSGIIPIQLPNPILHLVPAEDYAFE